MPNGPNLFARLHKWAARQDENFLTEALAVVLEHLLLLAPEVGTRLLSRLTGGFIDVPPGDASAIEISRRPRAGVDLRKRGAANGRLLRLDDLYKARRRPRH